MCMLLFVLLILAIMVAITIIAGKRQHRPKRIMREGKLLKSEMVSRDGEMFYVEKVAFNDRQVEVIALVRSFRPIPVDEFDRIARPLIM